MLVRLGPGARGGTGRAVPPFPLLTPRLPSPPLDCVEPPEAPGSLLVPSRGRAVSPAQGLAGWGLWLWGPRGGPHPAPRRAPWEGHHGAAVPPAGGPRRRALWGRGPGRGLAQAGLAQQVARFRGAAAAPSPHRRAQAAGQRPAFAHPPARRLPSRGQGGRAWRADPRGLRGTGLALGLSDRSCMEALQEGTARRGPGWASWRKCRTLHAGAAAGLGAGAGRRAAGSLLL